MKPSEVLDEAKKLRGLTKRQQLLAIVIVGLLAIGGLAWTMTNKFAETVASKKAESWMAASEGTAGGQTRHRKIVGDWCMVMTQKSNGPRQLMWCYPSSEPCTNDMKEMREHPMLKPSFDINCVLVPGDAELWCSTAVTSPIPWMPDSGYGEGTVCYFDRDSCDARGELCFPTTKAAMAQ